MHRALTLGCLLVLVACVDRSPIGRETPPALESLAPTVIASVASSSPTPDWGAEITWARARFPQLVGMRAETEIQALLAWVPIGKEMTLFFTVEEDDEQPYRCARTLARRAEENSIALKILGPEKTENGQKVRKYFAWGASAEGLRVNGSGTQKQNKDGAWEAVDELNVLTGRQFGHSAGPIDGDAAHFRYEQVALEASCGPVEPMTCEAGGSRHCNTCREVQITATPNAPGRLLPPHKGRPLLPTPTCSLPCPPAENADLTRIRRLFEHLPTAYVLSPDRANIGLYRTVASCEANSKRTDKAGP